MDEKHEIVRLSIVIPVYNSERTIGKLVEELIKELRPIYRLEIVLVNDASTDDSEKVCISLFEKYKDIIRFYSLSKNSGEHSAVMAGLSKTTGDYVVIMDDDLQNPVSEVNKLVSKFSEADYDVVYSYYKEKKHSFLRNLGSRFNDKVANWILNKPKGLYLSSFKAMNRFVVDQILKYKGPFPYIDGLILQVTDKIGRVMVEHHPRSEGKSGYTLKKLITLWLNMFTSFSILPLRFSIFLGFIFSLLGICLGIYSVIEKFMDPDIPIGYASLFVAVSIFAGIQLIMIGMVGEYLGRVFLTLNTKPQYTIKKAFEAQKTPEEES
jgi:undecaprenyl-phosphate 4-deoxy-4-formamido-L-arabinose transferase